MEFEWDARKEAANRRKHGLSFEEAREVFFDPQALLLGDPDHADDETRFVILGIDSRLRCLVVCHSYDEPTDRIRIFSARRTDARERRIYVERLR